MSETPRISLLMRFAHLVLRARGVKRTLQSAAATEAARAKSSGKPTAKPSTRVGRRLEIAERTDLSRTVLTARSRGSNPTRKLIYFHGGGYINDLVAQQWALVAALAGQNNAEVLVPLYRVAPESTASVEVPALADLVEQLAFGIEVGPLVGDSAGGGLAAAVAEELRVRGKRVPHLVLFSPWLDIELSNPDIAAVERADPSLAAPGLRYAGRLWAGDLPPSDPAVSPLRSDLRGFPPTTMVIGTHDIFLPDCRLFAERARSAGVDLCYVEVHGAFHVFVAVPALPEASRALEQVRERLAAG
ncbi:Acetyl esterase/lipase [Curtobacterium sp. 314Chir4.1]|uniref:alpha/beta hydrolase fold domain-containing protein n=1 Tax=Curtobacterium sp. 314Chir4.1 TaxID=1279028 RepID=UPI000BD34A3F|nr:alpha/beta hydrolase fold domain-containing protein [Curtobacterium sp. 314Chir4.1]SOC88699.1 Acetyl esterase/lipase [Curtobacterium sp. 314Chir4.1]